MGKINEDKTGEKKKRGRNSCCEREGLRRGAWTAEEDKILVDFITENGHGTWRNLPKLAGLLRCGKSCRLRWTNYLRPDIKHGPFSPDEENTIIQLHESLGNKWAAIASHLPGRTDNDVKNFWNSHLRKRFSNKKLDRPSSSKPAQAKKPNSPLASHMAQWESIRLEAESRFSAKQAARPPDFPPGPNAVGPHGDYYLNLWNSEIGSSFRKEVGSDEAEESSRSPTSQMSSSVVTKAEKSGAQGDGICEDRTILEEDSSDAMMKLLLDFPVGEDDDDDVAISQGGNVNELGD